MATERDINQVKFQTYKNLRVIDYWNERHVTDEKGQPSIRFDFTTFGRHINGEAVANYNCIHYHKTMAELMAAVVARVEANAPADALLMVQRATRDIIQITGPGKYSFDGKEQFFQFPPSRGDITEWFAFYRDLVKATASAEPDPAPEPASVGDILRLEVYRGLGVVQYQEPLDACGRIFIDNGCINFRFDTPVLEISKPRSTAEILEMIDRHATKSAIQVAQLVFDGILKYAKVVCSSRSDVVTSKYIAYGYRAENGDIQYFKTKELGFVADVRGNYYSDGLYQDVLNAVALLRMGAATEAKPTETLQALASEDDIRQLKIYRELDIVKYEEPLSSCSRICVNAGVINFGSDVPTLEFSNLPFSATNVLKLIKRHGSGVAMNVAKLVLDGTLEYARVVVSRRTDQTIFKRIDYAFIDENGLPNHLDGPVIGYMADRCGYYCQDSIYQDLLLRVESHRKAAEYRKTKLEMKKTVAAPAPAGPRSAFTFGRSKDEEGIYEIIDDPTVHLRSLRQTKDGHWYCHDDETDLNTKPIFYDVQYAFGDFGKNGWIVAACRFPGLYDPTKRYIILADCDEDDYDHPAAVLYHELTNTKN